MDNNRLYESDKAKKIIKRLQDIEESIYEVYESSYVIRILEERNVPRYKKCYDYKSLSKLVFEKEGTFIGVHFKKKKEEILNILRNYNLEEIIKKLNPDDFYWGTLSSKTNEIERKILNALISNIIGVNIDDTFNFNKLDNKPIFCWEFRILLWRKKIITILISQLYKL